MRQTGYYYVKFKVDAPWFIYFYHENSLGWLNQEMNGVVHVDADFYEISPTPITPEKMSAIESIISEYASISGQNDADNFHLNVDTILTKHGLLPKPEKPKAAYYKGKKLIAVFNIPDETKFEIFVPHRIQVDKSEIEWREISNQNTN